MYFRQFKWLNLSTVLENKVIIILSFARKSYGTDFVVNLSLKLENFIPMPGIKKIGGRQIRCGNNKSEKSS